MAKLLLRKYIRELESQIDHSQLDEAIAHCRHILRKYPKHLDTYRMLGKAYLEARRYNEATDIFHRLLMAVPDDFVAHVGMSIINDVQQNMDAAIWHMERAFEVQPSNSAIQGELQRLYSRRDGVEPPKIRLTRGALSHMYVQGELYPQAISEIAGVLEEDAGRQDMQVLLARAYFHAGQKNESAEICSQLIRRYPYCLDANRVLVELIPETEDAENAQVYRNRVCELDPYAAFVTGSIFRSEDVPDEAVSLDRLEWDGQPVDMEPEWGTALGIAKAGGEAAMGDEPTWLKSGLTDETPASPLPDETPPDSKDSSDIPSFLKEAGWGASSGDFQEGPASSDDSAEPAIEQGDMPDWVKAMAPEGADTEGVEPATEAQPAEESGAPDWLESMGTGDGESGSAEPQAAEAAGDLPDWLNVPAQDGGETPTMTEDSPAKEGTPEWLGTMQDDGADAEAPVVQPSAEMDSPEISAAKQAESALPASPVEEPAAEDATSEWLDSSKPDGIQAETSSDQKPGDEGVPDWLQSMEGEGAESTEQDAGAKLGDADVPEWLKADSAPGEATSQTDSAGEPVLDEQMLEGWLDEAEAGPVEGAEPAVYDKTDTGSLGTSENEQDEALSWLEGLAAKHGAKSEELLTKPDDRAESEPEWVAQAKTLTGEPLMNGDQAESAGQEPPTPAQEPSPEDELAPPVQASMKDDETVDLGISPEEQDEALSWLEGLAAGHGAKPEELLTKPEERMTTEPEWVQQAKEAGEAQPDQVEPQPQAASETPETASNDLTGIFMQGLDKTEALGESEPAAAPDSAGPEEEPIPDWIAEKAEDVVEETPTPAPVADESSQTADPGEQSKPSEPVAEQESAPPTIEPDTETKTPIKESVEDLPGWLAGLDEKEVEETSAAPEALPDWLSGQGEGEPGQPDPVSPADWQPAEDTKAKEPDEKQAPEPVQAPKAEEPAAQVKSPPAPVESQEPEPAPAPAESPKPEQPPAPPAAETASDPAPGARTKKTGEFSETSDPVLTGAQGELSRGNIPGAMADYSKLIKKGNLLDEVIFDLRGALLRYPVEVTIWQALGDAYMRTNRLQEALDAYTKAEELLR